MNARPFNPETIVIYSTGLLGGSIGLALKKSGYKGKIIGISSPRNREIAGKLGCIDEAAGYEDLQNAVSRCDCLFLCSPICTIIKTIEQLGKLDLPEGLLITDVGSTKKAIVESASRHLPPHVHFTGGHPMAGYEKNGPGASDPYLFQNATYVLTPSGGAVSEIDRSFAVFLEKYLGCRYLFLDPAVHDTIAATVSHVPHILAVALVCLAHDIDNQVPGTISLAAGGFRDMTRIASAPYDMWHDILVTNKTAAEPVLDKMISKMTELRNLLKTDSLKGPFEEAREIREKIPLTSKGFIHRLSEVLVLAKDQPGIISSISASLAEKNINIKDIEVLKVREGEGGTIRLAFETDAIAKEAVEILEQRGFQARERT